MLYPLIVGFEKRTVLADVTKDVYFASLFLSPIFRKTFEQKLLVSDGGSHACLHCDLTVSKYVLNSIQRNLVGTLSA